MRIEGISRVGSVDVLPNVVQLPVLTSNGPSSSQGVPEGIFTKSLGFKGKAQIAGSFQPDELIIGSNVEIVEVNGLVEAYARIRYDQDSRTVLIQIVNATNNEIIREIPPGAWEKMKSNTQFLTGLLTGRNPDSKAVGGETR